jgi:hypothetical protein
MSNKLKEKMDEIQTRDNLSAADILKMDTLAYNEELVKRAQAELRKMTPQERMEQEDIAHQQCNACSKKCKHTGDARQSCTCECKLNNIIGVCRTGPAID